MRADRQTDVDTILEDYKSEIEKIRNNFIQETKEQRKFDEQRRQLRVIEKQLRALLPNVKDAMGYPVGEDHVADGNGDCIISCKPLRRCRYPIDEDLQDDLQLAYNSMIRLKIRLNCKGYGKNDEAKKDGRPRNKPVNILTPTDALLIRLLRIWFMAGKKTSHLLMRKTDNRHINITEFGYFCEQATMGLIASDACLSLESLDTYSKKFDCFIELKKLYTDFIKNKK